MHHNASGKVKIWKESSVTVDEALARWRHPESKKTLGVKGAMLEKTDRQERKRTRERERE